VVFLRGSLYPDVLFIGEAPGYSEDTLGFPFVGPAGKLLDKMIAKSALAGHRLCFTNLVGCIPKDGGGSKLNEPSKDSIESCMPRVFSIISLCKPLKLVRVGKLATKYVTPKSFSNYKGSQKLTRLLETETIDIIHPAAILRAEQFQKMLAVQSTISKLNDLDF